MGSFSLTGADTAVIAGIVIRDVADGDWFTLTFPNMLAEVKTGKNGNSIFASNAMGQQGEATLRLLRGSADDQALDALLQQQLQDFSSFVTLRGSFVKRVGDGNGNITQDQYVATGGIFQQEVDAKSNAEGDTEQSVSVYRFKFANVQRALQ
jgi:hypothetical protein